MEHEWQGCGQRWPGNVILWKRGVTCFQTQQCDGKSPASQMGHDGCPPEGPRLSEPPDARRGRMWRAQDQGRGCNPAELQGTGTQPGLPWTRAHGLGHGGIVLPVL